MRHYKQHLRSFLFIAIALLLVVWIFRYEMLFAFQSARLDGLHAAQGHSPYEKIWAHRVNSLQRLDKISSRFAGFESDVVFEDDSFLVYHPPFRDHAFPLQKLLERAPGKKIWLDLRGVHAGNAAQAALQLDSMNARLSFSKNVLLELYDLQAANLLAAKGYRVALNIPVAYCNDTQLLDSLQRRLSKQVAYVSQEDVFLESMKRSFPGRQLVTWSPAFRNYFNRQHLQKLLDDPQVAVILVNIKTKYRY